MSQHIDSIVKGLNSSLEINVTDFVNLSSSFFISKKGNVQATDSESGTDKKFEELVKQMKSKLGDKSAVIAKAPATHYGFVNDNMSYYDMAYIKENALTWIQQTADGAYGRPVIKNHNEYDVDGTLGRVLAATPVIYKTKSSDLFIPNGHIDLIYYVSDKEAIEKIMDERYKTLSVGASASLSSVKCSICGRPVNSYDCEHVRGKQYDVEVSKNKMESKLCYWTWSSKRYREVSYVANPADKMAQTTKLSFINVTGKDSEDNEIFSSYTGKKDSYSQVLIVGDLTNSGLNNVRDLNDNKLNKEELYLTDSVVSNFITFDENKNEENKNDASCQTKQNDDIITAQEENKTSDNATEELNSEDSTELRLAYLQVIQDMLSNDKMTLNDSHGILLEKCEVYVPISMRDRNKTLEFISKELAGVEKQNADKLNISVFCGINRTFPVCDKNQLIATRQLMNYFKGSDVEKKRIMSSLDRKEKVYGSIKINDKFKEDNLAQFTFESLDALLASPHVQKAIDEAVTASEQKLDETKKTYADKEAQYKKIAIDAVISAYVELDSSKVASLKGAAADKYQEEYNKISEQLSKRSMESLSDSLDDLRVEIASKKAKQKDAENTPATTDANQAALDAASTASVGTSAAASSTTTPATEPAASTTTDAATKPADELNQGAANSINVLASITKKKQ